MVTNDGQSTARSTASTAPEGPVFQGTDSFPFEALSKAYGLTFTARELELLSTDPAMLDPIERQHAYLLQQALRAEHCPACTYVICQRSAWQGEEYDPGTVGDGPGYACPNCSTRLEHHQGLTMPEHWFTIEPGQTVHFEHHRGGGAR